MHSRDTVKKGREKNGKGVGRKKTLKSITLSFRGSFIEIHQARFSHRRSTLSWRVHATQKRGSLLRSGFFDAFLSSIKRASTLFASVIRGPRDERKMQARVGSIAKAFRRRAIFRGKCATIASAPMRV